MERYAKFAPTGFDPSGAFLPNRQDWLVLPVSQTRDSEPLAQSNFAAALEILGGESRGVEVHRFGHWGPGWFEIIIVNPRSRYAAIAKDIERALEDYPVLDDSDLSERENEAARESWEFWGAKDWRKHHCKEFQLGQAAENALDEFSDEDLYQWLGRNLSWPDYWLNGGERMPTIKNRDAMAAFLREVRRAAGRGTLESRPCPWWRPHPLQLALPIVG